MKKRKRLSPAHAEEMYKKHKPLAELLGCKYARIYGHGVQDYRGYAISLLGLVIAEWDSEDHPAAAYNESKCSPTSWIYRRLSWGLSDHGRRHDRRQRSFSDMCRQEEGVWSPFDTVAKGPGWGERLLQVLGDDAKDVVRIILSAPAELADDISRMRPPNAGRAVRAHFFTQGWAVSRIAAAWREVEEALNV